MMKKRSVGRPRKYLKHDVSVALLNAAPCRAYRDRLKRSVHFRSDRHTWGTPQAFFDTLDAEFAFTLDTCALPSHAKCPRFYTPADDGLQQPWIGICWCNPPYGRVIAQWVQKAYESAQHGALVVCLLPARVDTRWWHQYVMRAAEIRYLPGRLKFVGAKSRAPFPSAVVIFRPLERDHRRETL
jgi:phage N-6-adenine-methyltransferase